MLSRVSTALAMAKKHDLSSYKLLEVGKRVILSNDPEEKFSLTLSASEHFTKDVLVE